MELNEATQDILRLALDSHQYCRHQDPALCHALITVELGLRRGYPVSLDEELEACGKFIADAVLESLILKGMVETVGISEDGDFLLGLTEAGVQRHNQEMEHKNNE